jgi:hypothetical protein
MIVFYDGAVHVFYSLAMSKHFPWYSPIHKEKNTHVFIRSSNTYESRRHVIPLCRILLCRKSCVAKAVTSLSSALSRDVQRVQFCSKSAFDGHTFDGHTASSSYFRLSSSNVYHIIMIVAEDEEYSSSYIWTIVSRDILIELLHLGSYLCRGPLAAHLA